jgi:hypothetical protein
MNARKLLAVAAERSGRALISLAVVLVAATGAAHGDWLVLTSGETLETKGPWTLEGQKVVFTSTRGVLSSIRASSVNVESSRDLTTRKQEEATRVVVVEPPPKREAVLVLTDADFKPAAAPAVAGAGVAPAAAESAAVAQPIVVPAADSLETRIARQMPGAPMIQIMNWSARPTGVDRLSIFGSLQNVGSLVAAAITVTVKLIDSEGVPLGSADATLSSSALMPGVQAELEAQFEGTPNFATIEFAAKSVDLQVGRPERGDQPAAEGEQPEQPSDQRPGGDQPGREQPSGAPARGDAPHATAPGAAPAARPQ